MDKSWLLKKIEKGQRKLSNEMLEDYSSNKCNPIIDLNIRVKQTQKYWSGKIPSRFHLPSCLKESLKVTNTPHNHKKEVEKSIDEFKKLVSESLRAIHTSNLTNKLDSQQNESFSVSPEKKPFDTSGRKIFNRTSNREIWGSAKK